MHMFFVAFNKRQKRICEGLEVKQNSKSPKMLIEDSPIKDNNETTKDALNVINLEEELDLE